MNLKKLIYGFINGGVTWAVVLTALIACIAIDFFAVIWALSRM